jgi:DNA-binding winged helix-turn-helix (wHTH) protein
MLSQHPSQRTQVEPKSFRAGNLVVDMQARRAYRDGKEIHLTELSFDTLLALLHRAPDIVSKEVLMQEVWHGTIVELDTVKKRIALLRKSLGDDISAEPLIRVAHGRGYGINAQVERLEHASLSTKTNIWKRSSVIVAAAFVASFLAIGLVLRSGDNGENPSSASVIQSGQKQEVVSSAGIDAIDPVAYQYYIEGKTLRRTSGDLLAATRALEQAIDIEPHFAAALAELAICKIRIPSTGEAAQSDGAESASQLAQRALLLDSTLPVAIAAAAAVAIFLDWNWPEADTLLNKGLEISPDNEYLLTYRSILEAVYGDLDEAIRLQKSAVAFDVTYARMHYALGQRFYEAGRFREAIQAYRRALNIDSQKKFAHLGIGRIRALQGDHVAALREMDLEPDPLFRIYGKVIAHTAAGNDLAAIAALEDFEKLSGNCCDYWLGALHAFRGDTDAAFKSFELAWDDREAGFLELRNDPLLQSIRDDPRYTQLLNRLGID